MEIKFLKSSLVKNSAWGIGSSILQMLFVSLFFAIIARKYNPNIFGQFLIATTVYQLMAAFSSMGLGHWFIREYELVADKISLTSKFLKVQIVLGLLFYLISIGLAFIIYDDEQIRILCIILGINIIFDNFINAIKSLNIAEYRQKKTTVILVIDGFLKFLVGCLLFVNLFSTEVLAILTIIVRIMTLILFIKVGTDNSINLRLLYKAYISRNDLRHLIVNNWQFVVISSISILYWRIGNIIISKILTLKDVANYELASAIFTIPSMLPVVASITIYPRFIRYFKENDLESLKNLYKNVFLLYWLFSIITYAFIYSFADIIIPLGFGKGYPGAILCVQQMFLTFLFLPTVLLQANVIVAMGLEKLDMWFNVSSLIMNVIGCLVGLYFFKSLSVVNYSILFSFVIFHISQDVLLIRKKLTNIKICTLFYTSIALFVASYHYITLHLNPYLTFLLFATIAIGVYAIHIIYGNKTLFILKGEIPSQSKSVSS